MFACRWPVARRCRTSRRPQAVGTSRPADRNPPRPPDPEQSKAILQRLGAGAGDAGLLQRHTAYEEAISESPLIAGNRTRLLQDGPETFRAMFAAIQGATRHINLEYYIFEDVESDGAHLGDLLIAKQQAGVAVNVIYDSYGSGEHRPGISGPAEAGRDQPGVIQSGQSAGIESALFAQ